VTDLRPDYIAIRPLASTAANGSTGSRSRDAWELFWAAVVSSLPILFDLIFQAWKSSGEDIFVNYAIVALSAFSLSATAMARAVHNQRGLEFTSILFAATTLQIILGVLNSDDPKPIEFFWWFLVGTYALTVAGILLTWLPGVRSVKQVRSEG
jgi:hypothetical protein